MIRVGDGCKKIRLKGASLPLSRIFSLVAYMVQKSTKLKSIYHHLSSVFYNFLEKLLKRV